jgi:proteic killer suppression protein
MIRRFRHKGLERFFTRGDASGINPQFAPRLRRMLTALDACTGPDGMNMPGFRLHPLKGERKGEWSTSVSGNWRLTFSFEKEDAVDVDLEDYH